MEKARENRGKIKETYCWKKTYWRKLLIGLAILVLSGCAKSLGQQVAEQLQLGQRYLSEMNYEEAIVAFEKVLELEPKELAAYTGII